MLIHYNRGKNAIELGTAPFNRYIALGYRAAAAGESGESHAHPTQSKGQFEPKTPQNM